MPGPTSATRRVTLPAQPRSCAVVRRFVRVALGDVGWAGDVEAAVLLSSELVAGAVAEARSTCQVTLRVDGRCLRVEAAEAAPDQPDGDGHRSGGPEDEHRRVLLDTLASGWGRRVGPPTGGGVWFELSADARGAPAREGLARAARHLALETRCRSGRHLVSLAGELDLLSADYLERVLDGLRGPAVVVDLAALDFIDVAGVRALASAKRRAETRAQRLFVVRARGPAKGLIGLLGLRDELGGGGDPGV